jgi:hypothetical protein
MLGSVASGTSCIITTKYKVISINQLNHKAPEKFHVTMELVSCSKKLECDHVAGKSASSALLQLPRPLLAQSSCVVS